MPTKIKMVGRTFGRLTVTEQAPSTDKHIRWQCRCTCGGNIVTVGNSLRKGLTTSCGCYRKEVTRQINHNKFGKDAPNWQGGRQVDKDGYVRILVGKRKYRPEHCVVMEQHLGRPLFPDETVHHKNGIRHDNRLDNLELKASSHGRGQTIPDLIAWAKEILQRYGTAE